jgi:hypothetical protein
LTWQIWINFTCISCVTCCHATQIL